MKPISGLTLALLFACGTQAVYAQTPTPGAPAGARPGGMAPQQGGALLRGTVLDAATGRPVPSATITVRSRADSALAGGAVTRADGTFRVEGLRPGRYSVRVSHLGHTPATLGDVTIAPGATTAQAPTVRLAVSTVQLEGLTATAERSAVTLSADRNTYSTRDMPAAAGGNSTDVLRNVPAVEVDQDGRVSLRGNQNVAVQINGRAAPMRGDQLGQFLQQLPANMVDRVEVIPNPSAKYDPEGMSGIVNIVLKGNADLGISGGATLSAGTNDRYNGSGNLGYQSGPLSLFGSLGHFRDGRDINGFSNRVDLLSGAPTFYLDQDSRGEGRVQSSTFNTSAEYKLSKENSLAATFLASAFENENETLNEIRQFGGGRVPVSRSDALQLVNTDAGTLDGTLSFRRVVQPRQNELSIEGRHNRSRFDQGNLFTATALDFAGGDMGLDPQRTRNLTDALNTESYVQADLTRMLRGVRVETGFKSQLRTVENDLAADSFAIPGGWVDTGGTNHFELDEQVNAVYGVLTRNTGKLELQGGLRFERTGRSTNREDDDLDPFTDYFPSALVAYNVDAARQVKVSYSKRIQRPQTQLLNSFLQYESQYARFRGNPYLRPEYTDAYELGFQQSGRLGSVQLTPFYRHTVGAIRRTPGVLEDGILTSTVQNISTSDSYGADANASLRAGLLTGSLGMSAFRQESDGNTAGGNFASSGFGWSARANANVRLSKRTDVSAFANYRAPMNTEFGRIGAFAMTNFALRQKFMNDKASLTFRVQDPFNMMRFTSITSYDDPSTPAGYELDTERRFGARGAFLSFNYTFGQTPRIRAPRPQDQPASDPSQPIGTP